MSKRKKSKPVIKKKKSTACVNVQPAKTTTARLLGHLEWLKANLDKTPDAEEAVYGAAIRIRAETVKDRTPDAILPKTVRRQLRAKVDALIATSREACAISSGDKRSKRSTSVPLIAIRKKIAPVTQLGVRAKLFDGQAVEWPAASQPMSLSELMAFVRLPNKDKEASRIKSPAYRRRVFDAFKTMLAAALWQIKAKTTAEKKLATEALEVGAAMLSEASRGLPLTPDVQAGRRRHRQIATQITGKKK